MSSSTIDELFLYIDELLTNLRFPLTNHWRTIDEPLTNLQNIDELLTNLQDIDEPLTNLQDIDELLTILIEIDKQLTNLNEIEELLAYAAEIEGIDKQLWEIIILLLLLLVMVAIISLVLFVFVWTNHATRPWDKESIAWTGSLDSEQRWPTWSPLLVLYTQGSLLSWASKGKWSNCVENGNHGFPLCGFLFACMVTEWSFMM